MTSMKAFDTRLANNKPQASEHTTGAIVLSTKEPIEASLDEVLMLITSQLRP